MLCDGGGFASAMAHGVEMGARAGCHNHVTGATDGFAAVARVAGMRTCMPGVALGTVKWLSRGVEGDGMPEQSAQVPASTRDAPSPALEYRVFDRSFPRLSRRASMHQT